MKYKICNVIDVESTCWENENSDRSEIIEIGICEVDLQTFDIRKKRSIYVKPQHTDISKFCSDLTGITSEKIEQEGITLAQAFDILRNEYDSENRIWVSHGDYDKNMFLKECSDKHLKYPFLNRHLNLKLLFSFLGRAKEEMGLMHLLKTINQKFIGRHHSGQDDAYNIARILIHIFKNYHGTVK